MRTEVPTYCRICEALCGLVATVEDGRLVALRADADNPHSKGFCCTKGVSMPQVVHDPDRVLTPLKRVGGPGEFAPTTWDEALDDIAARLRALRSERGPSSIAVEIGNPVVFNHAAAMASKGFQSAIGTPWYYGMNAEDVASRIAANKILYGHCAQLPIPDYRRTEVLVVIGANPWVSKGSLFNDPRLREHLTGIVDRGGRVFVVDPRRTETAKTFEHVPVRAGADAWFLLSVLHVLVDRGLHDEAFLRRWTSGWDTWRALLERFPPAETAALTGVPEELVVEVAEAVGRAGSAVVYGRTGTCTQRHGTLVNVLQDLVNIVTGNLQRPGGWVWGWSPAPVGRLVEMSRLATYGATRTRVAGLPDCSGMLPANALADEITVPGDGQVRALVMLAANPVVSTPDGERLAAALESLELFVSLDLYVNESNRHADYVLPATSMYERSDVPLFYLDKQPRPSLQVTDAVVDAVGESRPEDLVLHEIARRMGLGSADATLPQRWLARLGLRMSPMTSAELLLRIGKVGDWFGLRRSGWSWRKVAERAPHGVVLREDLPLEPVRRVIRTRGRRIPLDDPRILDELARLEESRTEDPAFPLRLIGMREMRSHNSWMHNPERLMPDSRRLTLRINPLDAARAGLQDGDLARVTSKAGALEVPVTVTEDLIGGTVALPHGWGHQGSWQRANAAGGVSSNVLASSRPEDLERLAGMSVLNGIPVRVERADGVDGGAGTLADPAEADPVGEARPA